MRVSLEPTAVVADRDEVRAIIPRPSHSRDWTGFLRDLLSNIENDEA